MSDDALDYWIEPAVSTAGGCDRYGDHVRWLHATARRAGGRGSRIFTTVCGVTDRSVGAERRRSRGHDYNADGGGHAQRSGLG